MRTRRRHLAVGAVAVATASLFGGPVGLAGLAHATSSSSAIPLVPKAPPSKLLNGLQANATGAARAAVVGGSVAIDATASGDTGKLLADLTALGLTSGAAAGHLVSGNLPISSLAAAGQLPSLAFAQPALSSTSVGLTTSQGDAAMGTDLFRTANPGVDGTGVQVGVLSDSYNCLGTAAADVASNDLPTGGLLNLVEAPSCASQTDEGRAMLQIVHDVAPGSGLRFESANGGQAVFANNITDLRAKGSNVITDDVNYFAEPFFQDGVVAQAVDNAVTAGGTYFAAAANSARRSWQGAFVDSGVTGCSGGHLNDFDPGPGTDTFQSVTIPGNGRIRLEFQWDQPFASVSGAPGSASDVDICLYNAAANAVVASSTNGNIGGDPNEFIDFTNPSASAANFNIAIDVFSGANPGLMKYVDFGRVITVNDFATNSSTLVGHANSNLGNGVAAAFYNNTPRFGQIPPLLEGFSSGGGTPILFTTAGARINGAVGTTRVKPEFTAPDGVNTTFFGSDIADPGNGSDTDTFPNFFGTSAAAPHAAGMAALLLQLNPAMTAAQIRSTLESTALDMGPTGFDQDSGFGLIQTSQALAAICASPPASPPPGAIVIAAPGLTTNGTPGNDVIWGTSGQDIINGGGGNDVIFGFGGQDTIDGGPGNDIVCGGDGNDNLHGGDGNDLVSGDNGNDSVNGDAGDDVLLGGPGYDRLDGGTGTNSIDGGTELDQCLNAATIKNCP